jgi:hypothetical protein
MRRILNPHPAWVLAEGRIESALNNSFSLLFGLMPSPWQGNKSQGVKKPQFAQNHAQVVASAAQHRMYRVAQRPLSQFRSSLPSAFMWPMAGSMDAHGLNRRRYAAFLLQGSEQFRQPDDHAQDQGSTSPEVGRQISRATGVSVGAVSQYAAMAKAAGLHWAQAEELDEAELERRLYGAQKSTKRPGLRALPDFPPYVHRELRRKGVTLQLLWEEYLEANPGVPIYQYTQFCCRYRD